MKHWSVGVTALLTLLFVHTSSVLAANDFTIGSISVQTPAPYENGHATMKVRIDSTNTVCSQSCTWSTNDDSGSFNLEANSFHPLNFNSNAIPNLGLVSGTLSVTCSEPSWCGRPETEQQTFSHSYPYFGDNQCLTTNNYEDCTITPSDCPCTTQGTRCINLLGSGQYNGRTPDNKKCVTFCGNDLKESQFETCSTCPSDVGKCDGSSCVNGDECEGKYCIHETCWNKPWKEGDGFCDINKGESCKNSAKDCTCASGQRCGQTGICETYCGNSNCEKNEEGVCKEDCDWCGDTFCQEDETCSTCEKDCGNCEAKAYCGDNICNSGECKSGCTKDCSVLDCQNGVCEQELGENCVTTPNDCKCNNGYCNTGTGQCVYQSCGNGVCDNGETPLTCANDCKGESYKPQDNSDKNYPIIFLHGHSPREGQSSYSMHAFSEMQNKLANDLLYENKGYTLPKNEKHEFQQGQWSNTPKPISLRTTYYMGEYSSITDSVAQDDNYPISEYSRRLSKVIDNVLYTTGKNKLIIVAHSMGGLVARYYIKNLGGINKVDKLIIIGTPNHGFWEEDGWNFGCDWIHSGQECEDMQHDSFFITNLNSGDETPGDIRYITIAGKCEPNGNDFDDEVVRVNSVRLNGANNLIVEGSCISGDDTFHSVMLKYQQAPQVYNYIISALSY